MNAKIDHADVAMQNAGKLIQQVANSASKKQNKANVRKILTALQQTMGVLGGAAEADPRAKAAVTVFMSVLQLELDRRDNEDEIVAVCYSMTSMVYVLRHLNSNVDRAGELLDQLEEQITNMSITIKEFGAFTDVYYTKCKSRLVRFARAGEFKAKIREFVNQFQEYQSNIEFVLIVQMAGNQARMAEDLREVTKGISTLIDHVGVPSTDSEKKAWDYIKKHGIQVLETEEGQTAVAKILQESITSNTIQALNSALDDLLDRNSTLFEVKLRGATMELAEAIDRSTNKILNRMESGPHDLIDDPDVKEIWKGNGWKYSVKCRTFIDAVSNHYTGKFAAPHDGDTPDDTWTLKILGKVINYPSLGEAMDEDASGFISVHEANHFLKKNKEDSTPTWFAFWAVGPLYLNDIYTEEISAIMDDLEDLCNKLKSGITDDGLDLAIDGYLDTIKIMKFITEWGEYTEGVSGVEDMDLEREDLVRVADRLSAKQRGIIEEELERIDYRLTAASMLPPVTQQTGFRIEQHILLLLSVILRKHYEIISGGMQNMSKAAFASEWEAMDFTLTILVFEFHDRFTALCRSWRSQKQDYIKPKNLIAKLIEDDEDEEDEDTDATTPASVENKVDQLTQRVSALDTRLNTIESMLKRILDLSSSESVSHAAQGTVQGDTRGVRGAVQHQTAEEEEPNQYTPPSGGEEHPPREEYHHSGEPREYDSENEGDGARTQWQDPDAARFGGRHNEGSEEPGSEGENEGENEGGQWQEQEDF
ncbi:hypothetical protein B0H16DRAFT_1749168 [Mycena metata]|uniref:EF-hand domain-containing protein n=1 Tax=Mycena metata TaxID=1033252 RepID=A0AAD7GQE7_9AGAR|nr:hypothetical protein B0H16DRAFT_1749168 [Mycena metata]